MLYAANKQIPIIKIVWTHDPEPLDSILCSFIAITVKKIAAIINRTPNEKVDMASIVSNCRLLP